MYYLSMDAASTGHPYAQLRLPNFDYSDPDHAYFVTIRAKPETAPFADDRLAQVILASLRWLQTHRGMAIYAYCLMPDHLHLLLQLDMRGQPLGEIVGSFKRFTTRQSWNLGYSGALWQGRFYDHILRRSEDGARIAAYILANPVRKGLVSPDEDYPYGGVLDQM